jgi:hypothetical protein
MRSLFARIPFRESLPLIITCVVVLLGLLALKEGMGSPDKAEKRLQRLQEKARAEGGSVAPEAYVPVWLYKGLKVNLAIVGALLLASPWLGKRRTPDMKFSPASERQSLGRGEIIACILLMGLAAWNNQPRLFHSMWGDEEFNASRFILDRVERQPDGSLRVTPREWTTTLWNMRKPTNHLGYSVFARLSHDTFFHKSTGPDAPWFSEALLRAPIFVAGLLLIPAFIWALRVWGIRAWWWGLPLLLLHPWFTRFGVDGRGYGFIMLSATLMLGVVGRGLQTGRWLWWALFGLGNFFMIWSNLQGVYPVVALNLTAMFCLLQLGLKNPATWLLVRRWFVANMLTFVIMVGWLAPCLPQLQEFMAKGEIHGTLDARFWQDSLSAWLFGQPFQPWDEPENPYRYAWQISAQTLPVLHLVGALLFIILLGVGICALLRKPAHRALLFFTLGAPALMLLHMYLGENRPYDWYFCPFIPGLFLMAAAGGEFLAGLTPVRTPARAATQATLVITVLLFAFITRQPRSLLRAHAIEPSRDAVASYRAVMNPRNPDIDKAVMSGAFRMYTEGYDPAQYRFDTVEQLRKLMAESDQSGRPFYINVGFFRFLQTQPSTKPVCDLLTDPTVFELKSVHYGLLHPTTRQVFRYKGKSP